MKQYGQQIAETFAEDGTEQNKDKGEEYPCYANYLAHRDEEKIS